MTLNPFVFGSASSLKCFDESAPCVLEQTSMCAIKAAQAADKDSTFPGQSAYVPWLICMDGNKDNIDACNSKAGISGSAITSCLADDSALIAEYLKTDAPIHSTPTVSINGMMVGNGQEDPTFKQVKDAICRADASLKACAGWSPAPTPAPTPAPPPAPPPPPYTAVCCHDNPTIVDCPNCKNKGSETEQQCKMLEAIGKARWCPGAFASRRCMVPPETLVV